ncbi:MAG: hypothetical protein VXW08_05585 [Candidatus Thermoplasmatota archaeon]|nr:hypothetical protein [Candidatus Thermoplasmatota archaeon]
MRVRAAWAPTTLSYTPGKSPGLLRGATLGSRLVFRTEDEG